MGETEWVLFCSGIGLDARTRLLAVFEHFCDHGEADLPGRTFGWLSQRGEAQSASRQGAFEAHGVVVRGRAAEAGKERVFFVNEISVDPAPPTARRSRRTDDRRQARLPFPITPARKEPNHG